MAQPAPVNETARLSAAQVDYNNTTWGILYGALLNGLGLSPATFQLIYPFVSWNWAPANLGYTVAAQYDFCATMPEWSATGVYASAATRFNDGYKQFLNAIMPSTTDPILGQQIQAQNNRMLLAKNDLDKVMAQAKIAYKEQTEETPNNPVYDVWLTTSAGRSWDQQIKSKERVYNQEIANLNSLTDQAQTPGLEEAKERYKNDKYYTGYEDPSLKDASPVPAWSLSQNSTSWTQMVQAGGGTPGNLGFTMADQSYDYKKTWAEGSVSVGSPFWEVAIKGEWNRIESFMSDKSLSVSVSFKAWDQVSITPGGWYDGAFVSFHRNGPFMRGYTAYKESSSLINMWGPGGVLRLMKTGMFVAYQPKVSLTLSQKTYEEFFQTWKAATGIRIGPFTFGARGGQTENPWTKQESGLTLTADSTSTTPLIFGVTVKQLP